MLTMTPSTTTTPTERDVLCGKDSSCMIRHPGNRIFREYIDSHKDTYNSLTKHEKMMLTKKIIQTLRSTHGTRFLKKQRGSKNKNKKDDDEDEDSWIEISNHAVRDKVGHALRFAAKQGHGGTGAPRRRRPVDEAKRERRANNSSNDNPNAAPTVHLNNLPLPLPRGISTIIKDQLSDSIDKHRANATSKADELLKDGETGVSSGFTLLQHAKKIGGLNAASIGVAPNLNTAIMLGRETTASTTLIKSAYLFEDPYLFEDAVTVTGASVATINSDADDMFKRQQAIFNSMSPIADKTKNMPYKSVLKTTRPTTAAEVPTAARPLSLSSSSSSLVDLLSAPVLDVPREPV